MPRTFAILPAAGTSTRMGQPKLLMPLEGRPLIWHTIQAWRRSRVEQVLVVVRPGDEPLAERVTEAGAILVRPQTPPPDMKASIQAALRQIEIHHGPGDQDAFLVAPADMPRLSAAVINRLIDEHAASGGPSILAPTIGVRRGHPVLFPWRFSAEVQRLPADAGLNVLVENQKPRLIACEDLVAANEYPFADIDTPEDLRRFAGGEAT